MPSSGSMTKSCGRRKFTWFEAHAELIRRIPLVDHEVFDHEKAYEHLAATKSVKPMLRCKIFCLSDGIKVKKASHFGQHRPRKFYPYKDINRFYAFADNPNILILGCADPEKDMKHYEFLKLEESHVQELCQLIDRAHRDPMYCLVDDQGGLPRYQSSQSSLTGDTDNAQEDVGTKNPPIETITATENETPVNSANSELAASDECIIEPEIVEHEKAEPNNNPTSPLNNVSEHIRRTSLFKRLCANLDENELVAVDMKYIEPNVKLGNQIADEGAIYVFVAHHRHPDHSIVCNGTEDGEMCNEINTAETSFTTTYVKVRTNT